MAQGVTVVCSLQSFSSHIMSVQFVSKIIWASCSSNCHDA